MLTDSHGLHLPQPGPITLGQLLENGAHLLTGAESPTARLEARLLLEHATNLSREALLAHPERISPPGVALRYRQFIARRLAGEPVAYIVGYREFLGRRFHTDHRALIPRPETEQLVVIGLDAIRRVRARGNSPRVIDVGTGTGAIAITIAADAQIPVLATDRSWPTLTLARENAHLHGQSSRVHFVQADLLAGISGPIHVLLANLPYIPTSRPLPNEIAGYEPLAALYAGPRGSELIERLLRQSSLLLAPGATVLLEIDGQHQASSLTALAQSLHPAATIVIHTDPAGLQRVLTVHLPG